jgi:patatin-like phospholipase/acyl hydrolase
MNMFPLQEINNGGSILCLDGGGIHVLILLQMLKALENVLGGPVIHTSFGYLALALAGFVP